MWFLPHVTTMASVPHRRVACAVTERRFGVNLKILCIYIIDTWSEHILFLIYWKQRRDSHRPVWHLKDKNTPTPRSSPLFPLCNVVHCGRDWQAERRRLLPPSSLLTGWKVKVALGALPIPNTYCNIIFKSSMAYQIFFLKTTYYIFFAPRYKMTRAKPLWSWNIKNATDPLSSWMQTYVTKLSPNPCSNSAKI